MPSPHIVDPALREDHTEAERGLEHRHKSGEEREKEEEGEFVGPAISEEPPCEDREGDEHDAARCALRAPARTDVAPTWKVFGHVPRTSAPDLKFVRTTDDW